MSEISWSEMLLILMVKELRNALLLLLLGVEWGGPEPLKNLPFLTTFKLLFVGN